MRTRHPSRLLATSRAAPLGIPSLFGTAPLGGRVPTAPHRWHQAGTDRSRLPAARADSVRHETFLIACYRRVPAFTTWCLTSPSTILVFLPPVDRQGESCCRAPTRTASEAPLP